MNLLLPVSVGASFDADAVVPGGWGEHRWNDLLGLSITGRLLELPIFFLLTLIFF